MPSSSLSSVNEMGVPSVLPPSLIKIGSGEGQGQQSPVYSEELSPGDLATFFLDTGVRWCGEKLRGVIHRSVGLRL